MGSAIVSGHGFSRTVQFPHIVIPNPVLSGRERDPTLPPDSHERPDTTPLLHAVPTACHSSQSRNLLCAAGRSSRRVSYVRAQCGTAKAAPFPFLLLPTTDDFHPTTNDYY